MKAYIIESNKKLDPFNEHPRDCLIGNQKLGEIQESILKDLGLQLITISDTAQIEDTDEHIAFTDSLYFSKELLTDFIAQSRIKKQRTVCALKPGTFTLRTVVATQDVKISDDSVEYGLYYSPADNSQGTMVPVVMETDQLIEGVPIPEHIFGIPEYTLPLNEKLVIQIDHWTNLWSANICSILMEVARIKKGSRLRLLGLAMKARSTNQWKVLRQMNNIGHNCDIHPKAYIEGSTIGDNVTVGAGTVIRECKVASNTFIENNVTLNFSVVGEGCYIGDGSMIRYSVLNPGTFILGVLSCSMLGRDTFIGGGALIGDFRIDKKPIVVLKNGQPVDTGNIFIGSCLGHGVYMAAGCTVAPGRTIPNGLRFSPEESRIIRKVEPNGEVKGYRTIKI
ncbi:hypothetical protein ACFLW0_06570 [Chloroflexota bacterium]